MSHPDDYGRTYMPDETQKITQMLIRTYSSQKCSPVEDFVLRELHLGKAPMVEEGLVLCFYIDASPLEHGSLGAVGDATYHKGHQYICPILFDPYDAGPVPVARSINMFTGMLLDIATSSLPTVVSNSRHVILPDSILHGVASGFQPASPDLAEMAILASHEIMHDLNMFPSRPREKPDQELSDIFERFLNQARGEQA